MKVPKFGLSEMVSLAWRIAIDNVGAEADYPTCCPTCGQPIEEEYDDES